MSEAGTLGGRQEGRKGEFIGVQLHSKVSIFSHPSGGYGTHMYVSHRRAPLDLSLSEVQGGRERGREEALLGQTEKPRAAAPVRVRPLSELYCPQ